MPKKKDKIIGTVVWGDNHSPFMHKASHEAIYQFSKAKKPQHHVHIGDCLDLYAISQWAKDDYTGQVEQPIKIALKQLAEHFNTIGKINPKAELHWILGNHDDRLSKFTRKNPAWVGITDDILGLMEYYGKCKVADRINIIDIRLPTDDFQIGKMHFCHGYYTSKYAAAKHVEEFEGNITHGHCHTMQMYSKGCKGMPRAGFSVGHLMDDSGMEYVKGKPTRAVRGFGYMEHIETSGMFTMHLLPIVDGQFIFDGSVYGE